MEKAAGETQRRACLYCLPLTVSPSRHLVSCHTAPFSLITEVPTRDAHTLSTTPPMQTTPFHVHGSPVSQFLLSFHPAPPVDSYSALTACDAGSVNDATCCRRCGWPGDDTSIALSSRRSARGFCGVAAKARDRTLWVDGTESATPGVAESLTSGRVSSPRGASSTVAVTPAPNSRMVAARRPRREGGRLIFWRLLSSVVTIFSAGGLVFMLACDLSLIHISEPTRRS
eukprot:5870318-Prymnesium_polylepis.1